ncbi:MAG: hypothetical protein LH624_15690 [Cryobacterium sp.]|nr:hypothetical protein [Cryobacterium sp.]
MFAFAVAAVTLWVIPTWTLTRGGDQVGFEVQPPHLLPFIIALAGIALLPGRGRQASIGYAQRFIVGLALTGAFSLALYVDTRRYLTGTDVNSLNLGRGVE